MEKIVILDTNSLIYRFYHILPYFKSKSGIPTNSLYGLANVILKIIEEENPDYFIACFDSPLKNIRKDISIVYKAKRPPTPDDLKLQISLAKKMLTKMGIYVIEKIGYEADDLIGTVVNKFPDKIKIIYSGDLDLLQILDKNTVLKFLKKGISEIEIYDKEKVISKFGIEPNKLADFKAITGDSSDNIIGVKGIGPKTAIELLKRFGNLENIIYLSEKNVLPLKLRQKILERKNDLILNKELATIINDLDIDISLRKYSFEDNLEDTLKFFEELNFYSIIKRLNNKKLSLNISYENKVKIEDTDYEFLENINSEQKNCAYFFINDEKIFLYDNKSIYRLSLNKDNLTSIFKFEKIIVYDLKNISRFYYFHEKEILEINRNFFDLKIAFWLVNNITKPSIDKLINFYNFSYDESIDKNKTFLYLMPKIYDDLFKKLENFSLLHIHDINVKISIILGYFENFGLSIDFYKFKELSNSLKEEIKNIKEKVFELAGVRFNINSVLELNKILFEKMKLPTKELKKTSKGLFSTQESELIKIKDSHPIIMQILNYRNKVKAYSAFLKNINKWIEKNNKIRINFEITSTQTGRIVMEKPNLQNLPIEKELSKEIRSIFIPSSSDFVFLSLDYSQIELRIAAHLSQDENLINIFLNNLDVHSITAKLIFGEENVNTRKLAKIINYGIIYGMSPKGLSEIANVSVKQAQIFMENYFKKFPGIKKLVEDLINKAKTFGYAETFIGFKRFIPEINSSSYAENLRAQRIAINTPIQGTVSDILKLAIIDIFQFIKGKNYFNKLKLLLIIHDELIFEVDKKNIYEIMEKIKNIMENCVKLSVPLVVKASIGKNLYEIK